MNIRSFAGIMGIAFALSGVAGFIPGLVQPPAADFPPLAVESGYGALFGLLPSNLLHNIFHLVTGLLGLGAARTTSGSRRFAGGLAVVYALLTVMGLIPGLNTTFGLIPIFGNDVWFHGLIALASALAWFSSRPRVTEPAARRRA